ncbi:hypothetical protein, partial [Streptomyces sp. SID6139]|uniref:hypothetical protein n=1 Tax=Streptomyces sp. SID6139 TaxID=2690320 RepID=UPI00387E78B0
MTRRTGPVATRRATVSEGPSGRGRTASTRPGSTALSRGVVPAPGAFGTTATRRTTGSSGPVTRPAPSATARSAPGEGETACDRADLAVGRRTSVAPRPSARTTRWTCARAESAPS